MWQTLRPVVLGCAVAMPACCVPLLAAASIRYTPFGNELRAYQGLIAGLLALIGALIGAAFLNAQIKVQRDQEQVRLQRRHSAARAVMPLALNSLIDFQIETVRVLHDARSQELGRIALQEADDISSDYVPLRLPTLPENLSSSFADMIEASDDDTARPFVSLLSDLQVQIARLRGLDELPEPTAVNHQFRAGQLGQRLWEAVFVHAAASALFGYARSDHGSVAERPDWTMVRTSMISLHLYGTELEALFTRDASEGPPKL